MRLNFVRIISILQSLICFCNAAHLYYLSDVFFFKILPNALRLSVGSIIPFVFA